MAANKPNSQQILLDFSSQSNDRRVIVRSALREVARRETVTLAHWSLLTWILNVETTERGLRKSLANIADELWCSPRTAARTLERLEAWQLISVIGERYTTTGQAPNEYRLNWEGIRALLATSMRRLGVTANPPSPGRQDDQGPSQDDQPPSHADYPPLHFTLHSTQEKTTTPTSTARASRRVGVVGNALITAGSAAGEAPASPVNASRTWEQVEQALREIGLKATQDTISRARERGLTSELLASAIAFYKTHSDAWRHNPGVLTFFVKQAGPQSVAADWSLWPSPRPSARTVPLSTSQAADREAMGLVMAGRRRKVPDEAIQAALAKRGLCWPGQNGDTTET